MYLGNLMTVKPASTLKHSHSYRKWQALCSFLLPLCASNYVTSYLTLNTPKSNQLSDNLTYIIRNFNSILSINIMYDKYLVLIKHFFLITEYMNILGMQHLAPFDIFYWTNVSRSIQTHFSWGARYTCI